MATASALNALLGVELNADKAPGSRIAASSAPTVQDVKGKKAA
jgi:hypothetical protein